MIGRGCALDDPRGPWIGGLRAAPNVAPRAVYRQIRGGSERPACTIARSWTGTLLSCYRRIVCAVPRCRSVAAKPQRCRRIERDGAGSNWSACPGVVKVAMSDMMLLIPSLSLSAPAQSRYPRCGSRGGRCCDSERSTGTSAIARPPTRRLLLCPGHLPTWWSSSWL